MANFEAFRWNFSSSTNSEIGRSDLGDITFAITTHTIQSNIFQPVERISSPKVFVSSLILKNVMHTSKLLIYAPKSKPIFFVNETHLHGILKKLFYKIQKEIPIILPKWKNIYWNICTYVFQFEKSSNNAKIWQKWIIALFSSELHAGPGTRNPDFGYPFRH